jgi:RHS repeat-associated protein
MKCSAQCLPVVAPVMLALLSPTVGYGLERYTAENRVRAQNLDNAISCQGEQGLSPRGHWDNRFLAGESASVCRVHYNWNRYFDPNTGRYISPDPLGLAGGDPTLFAYANSNPMTYIDPMGERERAI